MRPAPAPQGKEESDTGNDIRELTAAPALDGLRAVAVLIVIVNHLEVVDISLRRSLAALFLGVDVFFVLSGFLITALLLREIGTTGRVALGSFFGRRAVRLLPALVLLLAAHSVYAYVAGLPADVQLATVRSSLLYYFNWDVAWTLRSAQGLGHLWSLSVEGQFYLVWPFVVLGLALVRLRQARPVAPVLVLSALVLAIVVHRATMWEETQQWLIIYLRTDTRVDGMVVGAILAFLWTHRRTPSGRLVGLAAYPAAAFVGWCVARADFNFLFGGGLALVAIATAVVILAILDSSWLPNRLLAAWPMRALGRVSYGVYLWHMAVFTAVGAHLTSVPPLPRLAIAVALTSVFVLASWFLIERPALAWSARRSADRRRADETVTVLPPDDEGPAVAAHSGLA